MFPFVPEGLDDVVDRLVPELQRRGLFRRDYAGTTLRDHLGLARRPTASSRPAPATRMSAAGRRTTPRSGG